MSLLLTILSIVAAVAFLATLMIGLLTIYKPLASVRVSLQNIAMGVRAIEQETKMLLPRLETTRTTTEKAVTAAESLDGSLHSRRESLISSARRM